MRTRTVAALVALVLAVGLSFGFAGPSVRVAQAQDAKPLACDSTLVTLLLVAEHHYDYLSNMMMSADAAMMPKLDYGQYTPLIENIMAMMTDMSKNMSADDAKKMDDMKKQTDAMMMMDMQQLTDAGMKAMGMDMADVSKLTQLKAGDVAGEDAECSKLRADVEHFLLVHIIADMEASAMK